MNQYDAILYGNGLTLSLLYEIGKITKSKIKKYLRCSSFICDLLDADSHKRILREFNVYFNINNVDTFNIHNEVRIFLRDNLTEINQLGFERWVSKYVLSEDFPDNVKIYLYILYNHWYHIIHKDILNHARVKQFLQNKSEIILERVVYKNKIYTINFDTILDEYLKPDHLHGRFQLPLNDYNEIILHHFNDLEFEYKYLFGATGLEKMCRLEKINKLNQFEYDLDFFHNSQLYIGHLLIYGIGFGRAEMLSDKFLSQYPQNKNFTFAYSVDGHIIEKLIQMYNEKRLQKITISYYSEEDISHYKELFHKTKLHNIIDYQSCKNIFD